MTFVFTGHSSKGQPVVYCGRTLLCIHKDIQVGFFSCSLRPSQSVNQSKSLDQFFHCHNIIRKMGKREGRKVRKKVLHLFRQCKNFLTHFSSLPLSHFTYYIVTMESEKESFCTCFVSAAKTPSSSYEVKFLFTRSKKW
jgi:hypothetical protein